VRRLITAFGLGLSGVALLLAGAGRLQAAFGVWAAGMLLLAVRWWRQVRAERARTEAAAQDGRKQVDVLAHQNAEMSQLLERTVDRLQLLSQIHRELTERTLDLDGLLDAMAKRTAEVVGDAVGIYLPEANQPALRAFQARSEALLERARQLFAGPVGADDSTLVRMVVRKAESAVFNDLSAMFEALGTSPERRTLCEGTGLRSAMAVPLRSRSGAVIGAMLLMRQQSSPAYRQEDMELCEQVAERAASAIDNARLYRAREAFLALAAHELRTPTTALRAQAQLAVRRLDTMDAEKTRGVLMNVERQTARLVRLVNDLLDVSRIEAAKLILRREAVNASALAGELVERFSAISNRHLFVREDSGGAYVLADPIRLDQVISNLLSNAVKFSDQGEIRLSVVPRGNEVVLTVTDHGPGIPKDKQTHLFERFSQVEGGRRGGLGLGLYLSRELVSRMGGRIWFESDGQAEAGTSFHVALPAARAPESEPRTPPPGRVPTVEPREEPRR
jgi:signal transduction histidine kinase